MGERGNEFPLRPLEENEVLILPRNQPPAVQRGSHAHISERGEELNGLPAVKTNPKDSYNLLYLILLVHGVGTLMPWNMFINAKSYFQNYKLAPGVLANDSAEASELTLYRNDFMNYITLASQVPNLLCNFLNLFLQFGDRSLTPRIVISILVEAAVFIATVVLAMVDSSTWPITFFYITMALVVVLNMACGVYQNSIYGVAARLPGKYSNAVVLGSNISGTATSLLNIFTIAASPNARTAAIYYFLSALLVLLLCLDSYFALPLLRCYRHHQRLASMASAPSSRTPRSRRPPYWLVFKQAWPQCLNVFLIFFVTLAAFPAVTSDIKRIDKEFPLDDKYFTATVCFLGFNLFAMLGNILPIWVRWPGPRFLWVAVVARLVFLPLFLLCNYLPEARVLPVWVSSDWGFVAAMIVFAWSSGYLSSLAMMYAPRAVASPEHAPIAGMMAAFFLVLGLFVGGNAAFLAPRIAKGVWF
ncbi:equilibrative nucleoside transporter 1 [Rhipicephalus sanguineus]|uniref:equilibrative nucleoside transporter 1 n=1 Tax=Rhipicephalus sanguineus TaxID=34632 RepID=UPI0018932D1E|nr:equilibrative nucleoside transporter 1 [Rhipicephalus sanguineus]XP_037527019.1 equilibrative nucleoside transporter 1 [Rhipicephalus sanguineus]